MAPLQVVLMGDLNAKSRAWGGTATDPKGAAVEEWAADSGLSLLNTGTAHTCVRHNGGSVVDVSFATPSLAQRVRSWRVLGDVETLSDHLYVRFEVSASSSSAARAHPAGSAFPRWALCRLDRELAECAAIAQSWGSPTAAPLGVDEAAGNFRDAVTEICSASMPRVRECPPRRQVYWWSQEIADLRATSNSSRRAYTRCRRRATRDLEEERRLYEVLFRDRRALQLAISQAKASAREEMLEGLNRDPWGRPYKAAQNKLLPRRLH